MGKELPGGGTEPKPMTPLVKRGSLHHTGRPPGGRAYRGSPCGGERTRSTIQKQGLDAYARRFDAYARPKNSTKSSEERPNLLPSLRGEVMHQNSCEAKIWFSTYGMVYCGHDGSMRHSWDTLWRCYATAEANK